MMRYVLLLLTCIGLPLLSSCQQSDSSDGQTTEIFVSAAASLSDSMEEIKHDYEEENPDIKLTLNYGGSGKLAQQIQQGAPVDVFLSADQEWMDMLENKKMILNDTREDFVKNTLVMIGSKNADLNVNNFTDLSPAVGQIAIGNPESVPAGNYAKEALTHIDKWDALIDQFVYAKDVTQVLSYVESGNTKVGFVYDSDALRSDKVKVLAEADSSWHDPIVYPGAATSSSEHPEAAKDFVSFLTSNHAQEIFESYGFNKS